VRAPWAHGGRPSIDRRDFGRGTVKGWDKALVELRNRTLEPRRLTRPARRFSHQRPCEAVAAQYEAGVPVRDDHSTRFPRSRLQGRPLRNGPARHASTRDRLVELTRAQPGERGYRMLPTP